MRDNQLSRYGAISRIVPLMSPGAKYSFVGATTIPSYSTLLSAFPSDFDGASRVYPTIAAALADANATVTARGDILLVLPGHTETITTAAGVNINESGISIIGLGNGASRPTFTFTTNVAASFDITQPNVLIQNIRFVCGVDNQTAMNNVAVADVTFDNCEWTISNGTVGPQL